LTNVAMKEPVIDDGAVEDGPSSSEMELETTMVSKSSHDRTEEASKKPTEKVRERLSVVTHNLYCVYSRFYCTL
jgi:hypothetical protein